MDCGAGGSNESSAMRQTSCVSFENTLEEQQQECEMKGPAPRNGTCIARQSRGNVYIYYSALQILKL